MPDASPEWYHNLKREVIAPVAGETTPDHDRHPCRHQCHTDHDHGQLKAYAFRDQTSGKRIYAFWLAVSSDPSDRFVPVWADLILRDAAVADPVMIDVRKGEVNTIPHGLLIVRVRRAAGGRGIQFAGLTGPISAAGSDNPSASSAGSPAYPAAGKMKTPQHLRRCGADSKGPIRRNL